MTELVLDWNDLAPRTEEERYRIYRRRENELHLIATAGNPCAVGLAICVLYTEGEFEADDRVGLLNTYGRDDITGDWIISPFTKGM